MGINRWSGEWGDIICVTRTGDCCSSDCSTEPEPVECTGEEKFTDSIITCDPNALTLQVPKCAFENINFDWSKAYLAGPDKTPQLDGDDLNPCTGVENGNEIVFSILDDIKSCGTDVFNNGTHFIYSNAVQGSIGMSNSVISRTRHVKLDYECAFQNSFILTYGSAINTQLTTIDVTIDSVVGHFDIAFSLFTDDTFEFPIQGVKEFNVPELMHIGATLDADEKRLKLQLKECWATPSNNPQDETKYVFIENSCGIDEEINVYESLNIVSNGVSNQAAFTMESFTFTGSDADIYLHCNVHVCDSDKMDCNVTCDGGRKRRSTDGSENSVTLSSARISVNYNNN